MSNSKYPVSYAQMRDLHIQLDDLVAEWCDQYIMSGELAWMIVSSLTTVRQEQFKGNRR